MRALLHCGYSPHAYLMMKAGTLQEYRRIDRKQRKGNTLTIKAYNKLSEEEQKKWKKHNCPTDHWRVTWCTMENSRGKGGC